MAQPTVFISYSSADRREALEVRRLLVARGCAVWLDVFDIRVSADLKTELGGGIAKSDVLCLLLSPAALASPWVPEEIARGEEQAKARGFRTIAVLLRPCRPPDTLLGKVMLDATAGLASPDVRARLARAVLGRELVDDAEIDAAMQEALQARQDELEAALVLPQLAKQLDAVRDQPIRALRFELRPAALPRGAVLAVSLTFDQLFSQPMWFLFAHHREGGTWMPWMKLDEPGPAELRLDGKRVAGRFEWFKKAIPLIEVPDASDLGDGPAVFTFQLSGEAWRPEGAVTTYPGGPGVPHLPQTLELPSLAALAASGASFGVSLLGADSASAQVIVPEENDLDLRVTAHSDGGPDVTLFRSNHRPLERHVLKGAYVAAHPSPIEREAILGTYPPVAALVLSEKKQRRQEAEALRGAPETALSPEERRVVAIVRHAEAVVLVSRVFGSAPPPGPARKQLHAAAIEACEAIVRLLAPLIAVEPLFHDVGRAYWAASNLALFHETARAPDGARRWLQTALDLVEQAAARVPDEAEFGRWVISARERLARASRGVVSRP